MFFDIDYSREIPQAEYHLAKPNKTVISPITEGYDISFKAKLGNISELSITIPYYLSDNFEEKRNPNINLIKEKMLIKMTIGNSTEWFVIEEINADGNDVEEMTLTCFSLGYELERKIITDYETDSATIQELFTDFLKDTAWSIGYINTKFSGRYQAYEASDSNALECILEVAENFGLLLVWDTNNRKVSVEILEDETSSDGNGNVGIFRGLTLNHGKLLESITINRSTDELVTRLYIKGSEDLTINNVNPTGQNYIEDFTYFMHPFELNEDGTVKQSSHFMSDELCIALIEYEKNVLKIAPQVKELVNQSNIKRREILVKEVELRQLQLDLDRLNDLLDTARATENQTRVRELTDEIIIKENQIENVIYELEQLKLQYTSIELEMVRLYTQVNKESRFTEELLDELSLFVIEKQFTDENILDEEELYQAGLKKFEEIKLPKVVVNVDIVDFFKSIEEQYYWDKLVLGDVVKIYHEKLDVYYTAKIIEIDRDMDGESINLTIANTTNLNRDDESIYDLIYGSKTATSILKNNRYKWDGISDVKNDFQKLIEEEWDANKRQIFAGVDNSISIGKRGIVITNPTFPNEMLIIQSGIMAISKDAGKNWSTAINGNGIVAERLIGRLIVGESMLITNDSGSFLIDQNGLDIDMSSIKIRSSNGGNKIDEWNQGYEKVGKLSDDLIDLSDEFEGLRGELGDIIDADLTELESRLEMTEGRIAMVVSATNEIKSQEIASAITLNPDAINLISAQVTPTGDKIVASINIQPSGVKISGKNLDLNGTVTFSSFDDTTKNRLTSTETNASNANTTVNGWKATGKTTIDGGKIETDTVGALQIKTEELVVGENIRMGPNAVISWGNVQDAPSIPSTPADIGALPVNTPKLTKIDANGVYTGTVTTNQLIAGTAKISTGMIESLVVGSNVSMGSNAYISWSNVLSKPSIPSTPADIGAASANDYRLQRATYIDANGVYTGTIEANNIRGGTISGVRIDVTTDVYVGNHLHLGGGSSDYRSIRFNGSDTWIHTDGGGLKLSSIGWVSFDTARIDFGNAEIVNLNATAKFG